MEYAQRIEALLEAIKERNGKPVNVRVVAATMESFGLRDIDIQTDYNFDSIIELAHYLFNKINTPEYSQLKNKNQLTAEAKDRKRVYLSSYMSIRNLMLVRDYGTGLFHLLPVVLQIATIILFGFSLWTFVGFNNLQSTAVVFGVIIGLVATGGLVQVIGKQVSFYWYNEDYKMTYKVIKEMLVLGAKSLVALFVVIIAINFFINLYPILFIGIVFAYAALIGLLLLSLAPLYTIKKRSIISIAIATGTLIALWLNLNTNLSTYVVHWLGILISLSIALVYLRFFFKKKIKSNKGYTNATPKITLTIYRNINYFFYGMLVYVFIFMDRIIAWSSHSGRDSPYIIYYEKDYEIGMDLAILVFFLLAGVLEYSISSFSRFMDYFQFTKKYTEFKGFNKKMKKLYYKNTWIFIVSALIIACLLYLIIFHPLGYQSAFDQKLSSLSLIVFVIGGFGYLFLTFGMLNVLYLYTLNTNKAPVIFIAIVCLVNLIIGVLTSRIISYEYACVGMLVGAILFAFLTTRTTLKFFKNLDYYYYAAY